MEITTWAQIVSIIGIIGSISRIFSALRTKNYLIPVLATVSIFVYSFVLYGIYENYPNYLLFAVIILAITIVIETAIMTGIIILFGMAKNFSEPNIKTTFVLMIVFLVLGSAYSIFSLVIIDNARKYLIGQKTYSTSISPLDELKETSF